MAAGLCHAEAWYSLPLEAFADMNEILMVKAENQRRADEYYKRKAKKG